MLCSLVGYSAFFTLPTARHQTLWCNASTSHNNEGIWSQEKYSRVVSMMLLLEKHVHCLANLQAMQVEGKEAAAKTKS
jgi:hypothetical protein